MYTMLGKAKQFSAAVAHDGVRIPSAPVVRTRHLRMEVGSGDVMCWMNRGAVVGGS